MQQLREFGVGNRPWSFFPELHTDKAGVKVEREMSKQFRVLENILKLIYITHKWQPGIVVTSFVTSTKLLQVKPG